MKFFFIYKSLAHPELEGNYVQPFTTEERLAHARQAVRQLGSSIPWLVDPIDNRMKHALGDRPNSEFVIDPQGKIVRKRAWSDPVELRQDLEKLVGPVDRVTPADEIVLDQSSLIPEPAAKNVLTRMRRPGMFPLVSQPEESSATVTFYAKLRAEGDLALIDHGKGKLYLGFHLDPLHGAHWNHLTKPLRFKITAEDGVRLEKLDGEAARVAAESDIDPREFMIDVSEWPANRSIRVVAEYAACTANECHQMRQTYSIKRERDKDGGGAPNSGFRVFETAEALQWIMSGDADGDGRLLPSELNSILQSRFEDHDRDRSGALDRAELESMANSLTKKEL